MKLKPSTLQTSPSWHKYLWTVCSVLGARSSSSATISQLSLKIVHILCCLQNVYLKTIFDLILLSRNSTKTIKKFNLFIQCFKTNKRFRVDNLGVLSKSTRSKSTHVQNPPEFLFYFFYSLIYFTLHSLFIFCLFFTITVTPNP